MSCGGHLALVAAVHHQRHDYTDWQVVDQLVKEFLVHVEQHQATGRT